MMSHIEVSKETKTRSTKLSGSPTFGHIAGESQNLKTHAYSTFGAVLFTVSKI